MFKISHLFLIFFITTILHPIHGLDGRGRHKGQKNSPGYRRFGHEISSVSYDESAEQDLRDSLNDFERIKNIMEKCDVDLNKNRGGYTVLGLAIENTLFFNGSSYYRTVNDFDIIEYLLQHGAAVNGLTTMAIDGRYHTPLNHLMRKRIKNVELYENLIRLLLGYGATIDDDIWELAAVNKCSESIVPILIHHKQLVDQATDNPTQELLMEAYGYNKPYIVKLLVDAKPEFVELWDLRIANVTSPFSIPILFKAFKLAKLRAFAEKREIPFELVEHIGKFVSHDK